MLEINDHLIELRMAPGANTKGVLLSYQVAMLLKPLLLHPRVLEAYNRTAKNHPAAVRPPSGQVYPPSRKWHLLSQARHRAMPNHV